jgi:hypothetical protein
MPRSGVLALAELLYHNVHLKTIGWDFPEFDSADEDLLRLALALNASLIECRISVKDRCRFSSDDLIFGNDRIRLRRLLKWPTPRDLDSSLMEQRALSRTEHTGEWREQAHTTHLCLRDQSQLNPERGETQLCRHAETIHRDHWSCCGCLERWGACQYFVRCTVCVL